MKNSVRIVKRVVDVLGATAGLLLMAPLFPVIALCIKLTSAGPLIYRQRRAGELLGGAPGRLLLGEFDMLKFRTMRADAERMTGPVLAAVGDRRITSVGRFLRKTRLDELPQFVNVLRGEMSLVGPRPERPELLANLALAIPFFEERMRNVRPGITGLAQIHLNYSGRAADSSEIAGIRHLLTNPFQIEGASDADADGMRLKLLYDLAYAARLESLGDYLVTELGIILRTPLVMLWGRGT